MRTAAMLTLVLVVGVAAACRASSDSDAADEPVRIDMASLELQEPTHHLEALAREPMLAQHPSGTLFLAGYPSQVTGLDPRSTPQLWRSDDGGGSWSRVDVGTPENGAMGNSDVDLKVGPDGTMYFLVMGFDRSTREGTHVTIGVSDDVGATWNWSLLSETRFDDRPWVAIAPDGTAHVVWNDDAGVSYANSTDGGMTWTEHERINDLGGSSHLAVGPNGEVAVRISPIAASANRYHEGVDLIAVSTDGGASWVKHSAPGEREWDPNYAAAALPRWVEPLVWAPDGRLHYFWSSGDVLHLSTSRGAGATWTTYDLTSIEGVAFFPFMTGNAAGELAATWFFSDGEDMYAQVGLITPAADGAPGFVASQAFQPESWRDTTEVVARDPAGEYLPVLFLNDGDLAVAAALQDPHQGRYGFSFWRVARR